jgi:hypothetical protein
MHSWLVQLPVSARSAQGDLRTVYRARSFTCHLAGREQQLSALNDTCLRKYKSYVTTSCYTAGSSLAARHELESSRHVAAPGMRRRSTIAWRVPHQLVGPLIYTSKHRGDSKRSLFLSISHQHRSFAIFDITSSQRLRPLLIFRTLTHIWGQDAKNRIHCG